MRYFNNISIVELQTKIHKAWYKLHPKEPVLYITGHDYKNLTPQVSKDLSKVDFDTENWVDRPGVGYTFDNILGYTTLNNGLSFIGITAAGDWEQNLFFILYLDHKGKLRGYIPELGNLWNRKTRATYGNNFEEDLKDARKQFGDHITEEDMESLEIPNAEKLLIADITSRIVPAPPLPEETIKVYHSLLDFRNFVWKKYTSIEDDSPSNNYDFVEFNGYHENSIYACSTTSQSKADESATIYASMIYNFIGKTLAKPNV